MENKFILILAFLFLIIGVMQINPIIVLSGIAMLLLLIHNNIFNKEENKKRIVFPTKKSRLIIFLGNIDLILGVLLLLEVVWRIVPNFIIFAFALLLGMKAIPFALGKNVVSIIDIICASLIMSFLIIELPLILMIIISIYLLQKGILSLFI